MWRAALGAAGLQPGAFGRYPDMAARHRREQPLHRENRKTPENADLKARAHPGVGVRDGVRLPGRSRRAGPGVLQRDHQRRAPARALRGLHRIPPAGDFQCRPDSQPGVRVFAGRLPGSAVPSLRWSTTFQVALNDSKILDMGGVPPLSGAHPGRYQRRGPRYYPTMKERIYSRRVDRSGARPQQPLHRGGAHRSAHEGEPDHAQQAQECRGRRFTGVRGGAPSRSGREASSPRSTSPGDVSVNAHLHRGVRLSHVLGGVGHFRDAFYPEFTASGPSSRPSWTTRTPSVEERQRVGRGRLRQPASFDDLQLPLQGRLPSLRGPLPQLQRPREIPDFARGHEFPGGQIVGEQTCSSGTSAPWTSACRIL